jgi:hypothetical protein
MSVRTEYCLLDLGPVTNYPWTFSAPGAAHSGGSPKCDWFRAQEWLINTYIHQTQNWIEV